MVLPCANPTKSYWIEAADSPLRNLRSSHELPETADVVIIGGGYSGATTAYWLDKYTRDHVKQPSMVILEARDICGGATGRNGGQLRPHAYSRYAVWAERFGPDTAMELIRHEMAHLPAFEQLAADEGIAEEICLKFGETFDAAMTDEAWIRLKGALDAMRRDHGEDNEVVKACRVIADAAEAQDFSQMKGALAAIVHPAGQVWPYKFVHAILRIVLARGNLNVQAHTPVMQVGERDADGWIQVRTERGTVRARAVVHATNAWASHLLPEYSKLVLPEKGTLAAIKAPEGFIKHTGAQHWDATVNNYHLQLPAPYNAVILGGARQYLVHRPADCVLRDDDDQHILGTDEFFGSWPSSDVLNWPESTPQTSLEGKGGCWVGIETTSADGFPFVGPAPRHPGQWVAAGFAGHGMPRILLSTSSISTLVLESLGLEHSEPSGAAKLPLPKPFLATKDRIDRLQNTNVEGIRSSFTAKCKESSVKPFCNGERSRVPAKQGISSCNDGNWASSCKGQAVSHVEQIPLRV
ncbi:FAD dependent oxidoreductase [Apiospora arundinis]|uniref:FAD dependent oxidoreductase n=1 Tax=Apiospora arundinis TaxID=335852 RepID=A0ABR2JCQ2_9PEZI